MGRLLTAVLGSLAAALGVLTLWAAPAGAHAYLTGSNPADGSTVSRSPRVLYLDFSESVEVDVTRIDIVDTAGRHLHPAAHLVGRPADDTEVPSRLAVALPPLRRSAYTVAWRTVSSDDLHATSGVLVFGVDEPVQAAPFHEPAPRLDEAALRWIVFVGFALAAGAALWTRLARRAGAPEQRGELERVRVLGLVGAGSAAATAVLLLVDQAVASGGGWHALVDSGYALRWTTREAGLALLVVALSVRTAAPATARSVLLVSGTAGAALGSALLGHSAAGGLTRTAADALHTAATALWAGTLLHAAVVLVSTRRRSGVGRVAKVLHGFRGPALLAVTTTVVTGIYLASGVVGSVDAAVRTDYGRVLLIKLTAVGAAFLVGLHTTLRLHSRRRPSLRPRAVLAETVAAVAALALAAVLTAGQPATERRFVAANDPNTVAIQSATVADLAESLAVRPNRPGKNAVVVTVSDTRRPAPAPIVGVLVQVAGQRSVAGALPTGTWSAPVSLSAPGSIPVVVIVRRDGRPATRHAFRWVVGGAGARTAPALFSTAPLADLLVGAAGALAVAAALAGAIALAGARRKRTPSVQSSSSGGEAAAPAELVSTRGG